MQSIGSYIGGIQECSQKHDLCGTWEALDSSALIFFDVGVFLGICNEQNLCGSAVAYKHNYLQGRSAVVYRDMKQHICKHV